MYLGPSGSARDLAVAELVTEGVSRTGYLWPLSRSQSRSADSTEESLAGPFTEESVPECRG